MPNFLKNIQKKEVLDPREPRRNRIGSVEEDFFVINDIALEIPPEQIYVEKRAYNHEWNTLRTVSPQKVKSGYSIARVTIDVIFNNNIQINDNMVKIVAGLRATPFCAIYNKHLEGLLLTSENSVDTTKFKVFERYKGLTPVVLAMTSMSFNTKGHEGCPACIEGHFEFLWFNYFPYTPVWAYKTGEKFDKAGYAWESILWKKFYEPFLNKASPVDWPHKDSQLSSPILFYKEFAMVPTGTPISNKIAEDLTKIILNKPETVVHNLINLLRTDPDNPGIDVNNQNILDVLYRDLARRGLTSQSLREQLDVLQPKAITQTAGGLITPALAKLSKFKWKATGNVFEKNEALSEIKEAQLLLSKRAQELDRIGKEGGFEVIDKEDQGFEQISFINSNPSAKKGSHFQGGLVLMQKQKQLNLGPANDVIVEQINITFTNILATIPMVGYRYPTIQHIGSIDTDIIFSINTTNNGAKRISSAYDTIESMALRFKQIPQGLNNIVISSDFLGLFGISEYITKDLQIVTIPDQPGRSQVILTLTQSGITSETKLEDPIDNEPENKKRNSQIKLNKQTGREKLEQEFIRGETNLFKELWKVLNNHLELERNRSGSEPSDLKYYFLRRARVTNDKRNELFASLVDVARNNYNKFVEKAHSGFFNEDDVDAALNLGVLRLLPEENKEFGFMPRVPSIANGIIQRAKFIANQTGDLSAENNLNISRFKSIQASKRTNNSLILRQKFLGEDTLERIQQEEETQAKRIRRLQELGFQEYQLAQRRLFDEIQTRYIGSIDEFSHLESLLNQIGIGKGLPAYSDFKKQLRSVSGFIHQNNDTTDFDLLEYEPDTYIWYPILDGNGPELADINNFISPEIVNRAKFHSSRIFDQAQGSVDNFFQNTYRELLKDGDIQGPYQRLKELNQGKSNISLVKPLYSGQTGLGQSWQNCLNDPDMKDPKKGIGIIQKSIIPDLEHKSHTNFPEGNLVLSSQGDINISTNFTEGQWGGVATSSNNPNHPSPTTSSYISSSEIASISKPSGSLKKRAENILPLVVVEANKNGLPPALIMAVIERESSFNTNAGPNRASAVGLMQLQIQFFGKPVGGCTIDRSSGQTFIKCGPMTVNLYDPATNLRLGCRYLARLINKYGNANDAAAVELGLTAFNMGEGFLDKWRRAFQKLGQTQIVVSVEEPVPLTATDKNMFDRFGKAVSPTGLTPLHRFSNYAGIIMSRVPKWEQFIEERNFDTRNLAARYVPPKESQIPGRLSDSENIKRLKSQNIGKDVTTTLSSPLEQSIREFTINMLNGQAQSILRAYPTFKLYFIESDADERKRLAFDDFFSYNSVKSIKVIRSRKICADLCELYLTNISGILSNRKFRQTRRPNVARNAQGEEVKESTEAMKEGTTQENPIASLLLQEGIEISLKLGYSNDPLRLETVFNGVITAIQFTESEDLVRVVAQSHAIELQSDIKGYQKPINKKSSGILGWSGWGFSNNAATGRIMEEMLAEPEVLHFGRWIPNVGGETIFRDLLTKRWRWYPTPADDNIFAPPPSKDLDTLSDGLIINKLKYIIYRTTIWDIFKELEMRHPNMISSPVPYKDKFGERMTMFFGLPNQLYFVRDPNIEESRVQNKLIAQQKKLQDKLNRRNKEQSIRSSFSAAGTGGSLAFILPTKQDSLEKAQKDNATIRNLQTERLREARAAGFVKPFRSYHLLTSGQHIISNDIRANARDVANTIIVKYGKNVEIKENDDDYGISLKGQEESFTLKLDNALPTEEIRTQMGQFLNVTNEELAKRYALSMLINNMKEIYKGSITVIGNPAIIPYSVCYIFDEYTDMVGPIEVEEVVHIFDQETGFRTEIKPDMLVQAAEWSLLSSCEAMGIVMEGVLRNVFGKDSIMANVGSLQSFSPFPQVLGAGLHYFGGFMANKIINYTQLAQPVIMTPLLHHGRIFAGGVPTRKINTSIWQTAFGDWSNTAVSGYPDWLEDWKDSVVNSIRKYTGQFQQGEFGVE